jgi:LacI family transcriptional regulator
MPAVRLSDVAKDAGVSLATASRVLNGSSRIPGEDVTERVRKSARTLGYVTNAQAQALARTRTGLIGLVVHDISDPYFGVMARQIQQQAFASDAQILLTQTDRDVDTETRAIRSLISQRVDAIILVGTYSYGSAENEEINALLGGFDRNGGVVLSIGRAASVGSTIAINDIDASHELATSLVVEGYKRFAVVGGMSPIPSAANRSGGFLAGLTEAGFDAELSVDASLDRSGGHELARQVAAHLRGAEGADEDESAGSGPLCVFAPADIMALGALGELRRQGLRVPEDVAVAGYGGVPGGADCSPTLTTLALPLEEVAQKAMAFVVARTTASRRRTSTQAESATGTEAESAAAAQAADSTTDTGDGAGTAKSADTEEGAGTSAGSAVSTSTEDGVIWSVRGEVVLRESTALA